MSVKPAKGGSFLLDFYKRNRIRSHSIVWNTSNAEKYLCRGMGGTAGPEGKETT